MNDRFTGFEDGDERDEASRPEPVAIGDVLAELLVQYRARFPEANIAVVETAAA